MSEYIKLKEIEIKLKLASFPDYLKLIGFIGEADAIKSQNNFFYDNDQRKISALGYALRMRTEEDRAIVTLKSTTVQKNNAAIRNEIEETISLEQATSILENNNIHQLDIPPIKFLLTQDKSISKLNPILQFENERIKKELSLAEHIYLFEIDKTTYANGQVDYELEIELSTVEKIKQAQEDLERLFNILEIDFLIQKKSKFERALEIAQLL